MSDWKLRLYHHLPPLLRNGVASMRGYQLRRWRYGPETERLVAEALERDTWSPDQWQTFLEDKLARLLHRAVTQVPYYRDRWSRRRQAGGKASWEYLENWPILDKEPLRQHPRAFVADDCNIKKLMHLHTSGTTGKPIDLWLSRETLRAYYAIFEARLRRWYGVSRFDHWAILGGQLITPVEQTRPPFWVWNRGMNQLYMSSYHLAPQFLPHYLEALERHQIRFIHGYASSIYALAQEIVRSGYQPPQMRVVVTNAEPLYAHQREIITQAFGCPVYETYGMTEIVTSASECKHGQLHLWPDTGHVEIVGDGDPLVAPGNIGALICTGLINGEMPLIRYRVGDRGWLSHKNSACKCGRTLPVLAGIEGRDDDTLYTTDGRRVGRLDPVFKSSFAIQEAQIIQESLHRIRVRYVPDANSSAKDDEAIIQRLRERMGPVDVTLEAVDSIPRTSNGKFRAVICNLSPEERRQVEQR